MRGHPSELQVNCGGSVTPSQQHVLYTLPVRTQSGSSERTLVAQRHLRPAPRGTSRHIWSRVCGGMRGFLFGLGPLKTISKACLNEAQRRQALISQETLLRTRLGKPQLSQVWTAPAARLPAPAGPSVCQAGPEKPRAPSPPSRSRPAVVSDWAAVSRQRWTRQQALRISPPGV